MSGRRSLLHNAAVYSFSNILNAAIPFILLPVLTRVLAPSDYGVLAMFNASLGILGAFTGMNVHGAVNLRFIDRKNIDFPRYVGSCLCVLLASTGLTFIVIAFFLDPLSEITAIPPIWLLFCVLISGSNYLIQIRLGIWLMSKSPIPYGALQVSLGLLNMTLSLVFILAFKYGYEGRFLGMTIATVSFAFLAILSLYRGKWVSFRPSRQYMKESLSFGVPLIPHVVGGFLIVAADRFIIKEKLGLEAAGLYMVAVQLGMGMGLLADAFNKAFVPWLYEQLRANDFEAKRRIVNGSLTYFWAALIIASVVALASGKIIFLLAGSKYMGASVAFAWISFGQAFGGMYLMVTNYLFYTRQTRVLAGVTLLAGGIGVSLTWFLTPVLGITGAGLSYAAAMGLRFLMTWAIAHKVYPMPWISFCRAY